MSRFGFTETPNAVAKAAPSAPVEPPGPPYQTELEKRYPHVLDAIQSMWGYRELNMYFQKLMLDDRGGRAGFPSEVWDEIRTLQHLHQEIIPEGGFL